MNEIKVFRVVGEVLKPNFKTTFKKEVRALKEGDAIEKVYTELGSKHRIKRTHIKITSIEVVKPEHVKDVTLRKLTLEEVAYVK
ncbi:MAG: 50S ribosomal protein L18Ae [Candidatus Bathyarchaeia archaeon]